jgi:hypothetical protein
LRIKSEELRVKEANLEPKPMLKVYNPRLQPRDSAEGWNSSILEVPSRLKPGLIKIDLCRLMTSD